MTLWELLLDHQVVWREAIRPAAPDGRPYLSSRFALSGGRELDHRVLIALCAMQQDGLITVAGPKVRLTAKGQSEMAARCRS